MDAKGVIVWPTAVNLWRRLCPCFLQRQPADSIPSPSHGGSTIFLPRALSPVLSRLVVPSPYRRIAAALRRLPQHMAATLRLSTLTLPASALPITCHKCQSRNVPLITAPPPPTAQLSSELWQWSLPPLNLPPPLTARRALLKDKYKNPRVESRVLQPQLVGPEG